MAIERDGKIVENELAQDMMRRSIERTGKLIMACSELPRIGEVQEYAGLPLRCVRHVSHEEGIVDWKITSDIWGMAYNEGDFFFEVQVAD